MQQTNLALPLNTNVNLAEYGERIGYFGPLVPTFETLYALQALHIAAIPFEAIDVLLDKGVELDPAVVDAKLIGARRGGYCYEQNGLFKRVLEAIGFDVTGLMARVRWMMSANAPSTARSHMVLGVAIDGVDWLVDVGFGAVVPTAPLSMNINEAQPTAHETFRIIPAGNAKLVQAQIGSDWATLYEVGAEPQLDIDYQVANWYTSTHPSSHFRHRLIAARATPDARYALMDKRLTVREAGGEAKRTYLTADEIERTLRDVFLLPVQKDWRAAIDRAALAET